MFKNNLNAQHPLFAHPMGPPSIVPLISPDLMVKNLPAPPPPPSIHVVSDPQAAMNLNPDVPEFVPRNSPVDSKTEENCDTIGCEQIKQNKNSSTNNENTVTLTNTVSPNPKYGKNLSIIVTIIYNLFFFYLTSNKQTISINIH